jgi:hypothetical protein
MRDFDLDGSVFPLGKGLSGCVRIALTTCKETKCVRKWLMNHAFDQFEPGTYQYIYCLLLCASLRLIASLVVVHQICFEFIVPGP